jgi:small subunit ribosomal protein S21
MSIKGRRVIVQDGNFEKALRKFKKKISDLDLLQEVRDRQQYVKPTVKRKLAKSQAKRRWQKYLRDQSLPKKLY